MCTMMLELVDHGTTLNCMHVTVDTMNTNVNHGGANRHNSAHIRTRFVPNRGTYREVNDRDTHKA